MPRSNFADDFALPNMIRCKINTLQNLNQRTYQNQSCLSQTQKFCVWDVEFLGVSIDKFYGKDQIIQEQGTDSLNTVITTFLLAEV